MTKLSRRDFIKLGGAFSMSAWLAAPAVLPAHTTQHRNILILLFDAMSARHLSLYGYARETTPQMSSFAERATVYHSHYSAANFTTPSTGSLMLGMYPWKHRAHTYGGLVRRDLVPQNLFALLGDEFRRVAFAQTEFANILMNQFAGSIDHNLPPSAFSVNWDRLPINELAWEPLLSTYAPKTLLGEYADLLNDIQVADYYSDGFPEYPQGLPVIADNQVAFRLEDVFAGVLQQVRSTDSYGWPHISYYHLFSPHDPYNPSRRFLELFRDSHKPLKKPDHPLSRETITYRNLVRQMRHYDQYIAQVDHEFGLLIDNLEKQGLLQNTYIIVTSDHGELFERGITGHSVPYLFDSVIHIPLMIRAPGQTGRVDIHALTNTVDLLPTLLSLSGMPVPPHVDGILLPGFGAQEDPNRVIYSMHSPKSSAFGPLNKGTFAIQQGGYKLIYYRGYQQYAEAFEFYNLRDDPDEIEDQTTQHPSTAKRLKEQLLDALARADESYA